jgi:hypothetical protein
VVEVRTDRAAGAALRARLQQAAGAAAAGAAAGAAATAPGLRKTATQNEH